MEVQLEVNGKLTILRDAKRYLEFVSLPAASWIHYPRRAQKEWKTGPHPLCALYDSLPDGHPVRALLRDLKRSFLRYAWEFFMDRPMAEALQIRREEEWERWKECRAKLLKEISVMIEEVMHGSNEELPHANRVREA